LPLEGDAEPRGDHRIAENGEVVDGIGKTERITDDEYVFAWMDDPYLKLRSRGFTGDVRTALDNAIRFVSKCRHHAMGELTLNSVIATETILNPFNARGDSAERFAIFATALTAASLEERKETYKAAKELYNLRNLAVHQSIPHGTNTVKECRERAFRLFVACLKKIVQWAATTLEQGGKCDKDEFREFYIQSVVGLGDTSTVNSSDAVE